MGSKTKRNPFAMIARTTTHQVVQDKRSAEQKKRDKAKMRAALAEHLTLRYP